MHEHSKPVPLCEHKLKYCTVCDTVYCNSCKREWDRKDYFSVSDPINITGTNPYLITISDLAHPYNHPPANTSAGYGYSEHSHG